MRHLVTTIALSFYLSALAGDLPQPVESQYIIALHQAEARWQARKPKAYEFAIDIRCLMCDFTVRIPEYFCVVNGDAHAMQALDLRAKPWYERYNTVEKMFAAIRDELSVGEYRVNVQYHPKFGYPVSVNIRPLQNLVDGGLVFSVMSLRRTNVVSATQCKESRSMGPTASSR
jgi:hypothetical protein